MQVIQTGAYRFGYATEGGQISSEEFAVALRVLNLISASYEHELETNSDDDFAEGEEAKIQSLFDAYELVAGNIADIATEVSIERNKPHIGGDYNFDGSLKSP